MATSRKSATREPKLPHQRDQTTGPQSTSSATPEVDQERMRKAQQDLDSGKQDTDRGPVTDRTYKKLRDS
ncbi:MAG TPA: hypothetical protein VGP22_05395 [Albitalea sp.]|jgi:hypothetical protein|nr:hypothetical protein [Albitalea sp.]